MNAIIFTQSLRPVTMPAASMQAITMQAALPELSYAGGRLAGIIIPVFPATVEEAIQAGYGDFLQGGDGQNLEW